MPLSFDPRIKAEITVICFLLFCAMVFAFIPLVIKLFIFIQLKIGDSELFLVKFLQTHEQSIAYCLRGMCILGLIISLPAAIKDGFLELRPRIF